MIHGLELFVPCIEDEANHASRTEREAPNLWTVNFGREQSSRRATGLCQRSMNSNVYSIDGFQHHDRKHLSSA